MKRGWVAVGVVTYLAVYPDGRRCSVTFEDAHRYHEQWTREGVKVVTRLERCAYPLVGELELAAPFPVPHTLIGPHD